MAGKVDPGDVQTGAACDLDVDNGQRDGNALASVEDFVQEAVSRVGVMLEIADESQLAEEVLVEGFDARVPIGVYVFWRVVSCDFHREHAPARLATDRIEQVQVRS